METLLVVGAKGLGRDLALHFARRGFRCIISARTQADVERVAAEVDAAGGKGVPVVADLQDPASLQRLVDGAGELDLVVAAQTSGVRFGPRALAEISDDDFVRSLTGYPIASFHLLKAVLPRLYAQKRGTFVQIGTGSGFKVRAGWAPISAAQHALRALCLSAAFEAKAHGVHVAYLGVEGQIDSERSAAYVARNGLDKTLPPGEIARTVAWLHGQDARAYTHELVLKPAATD